MVDLAVGVDIGTSSARVLALDTSGSVRGVAAAHYPGAEQWPLGRAEPESWLHATAEAVESLRSRLEDDHHVAAIAVGGQNPTTVPLDGGLAVTYLDPVGAALPPDEQQLAQHVLLRRERGMGVAPLQLWDWVLLRLGARQCQGRWPGDDHLPGYGEVVPTGTVVGKADGSWGVPEGTVLVPAAQDAYMSFWAARIDTPGRGLDPGGRTGGLGVAVPTGIRAPGMLAFPSAASGIDIVGGPVTSHGALLDWWSKMTGHSIQELLELAEGVPPGANGVLALPYLEGERSPRWKRSLTAEIVGIGPDTGPAEVARALLEATAYGLAHIAQSLADLGIRIDVLVCGGSPAHSRLWCSIKGATLGVPVEIPKNTELAAYGAALAAGTALEWWPPPGQGTAGSWPHPEVDVLLPEFVPEYEEGFGRFLELGDAAEGRLSQP